MAAIRVIVIVCSPYSISLYTDPHTIVINVFAYLNILFIFAQLIQRGSYFIDKTVRYIVKKAYIINLVFT